MPVHAAAARRLTAAACLRCSVRVCITSISVVLLVSALASAGTHAASGFGRSELNGGNAFSAGVLQPPLDPAVKAAGKGRLLISWSHTPSGFQTGYELYRREEGQCCSELIAALPAQVLSHQDTGLVSGTTYYYALRARASEWASSVTVEVSGEPR